MDKIERFDFACLWCFVRDELMAEAFYTLGLKTERKFREPLREFEPVSERDDKDGCSKGLFIELIESYL